MWIVQSMLSVQECSEDSEVSIHENIQGAPKKMYHSDLYPISVLEVGLYFFTYVLEL